MGLSKAVAGIALTLALAATTGISTQQIRTAAPSAVDGTLSTSQGTSLAVARADHQHGPSKTLLPDTTATRDLGSSAAAWRTLYAPLIRTTTSAATATSAVPAFSIEPTATLDANDLVLGVSGISGAAPVFSVDKEGDVTATTVHALGGSSSFTSADIDSWNISSGALSGGGSGLTFDDNTGDISNVNTLTGSSVNVGNVNSSNEIVGTLATVNSLKIGAGTIILHHYSGTASLDYDLSAAGITCQDLTIAVPTGVTGDVIAVGIPNALASTAGVVFSYWESGANVVTVRACDVTSSNPNPAAATVRADVWQH